MKVIVIEQEDTDRVLLIREPGDSPEDLEKTKNIIESMAIKN